MREQWKTIFRRLKEYKREHGHCNVPSHRGDGRDNAPSHDKLGRWVEKQRTKFRTGRLSPTRIELLRSLSFEFKRQQHSKPRNPVSTELRDTKFNTMLRRIVEYVEEQGHGWTPQRYEGGRELAFWAKNRRSERKRGMLSNDRIEDLTKAGFIWEAKKGRTPKPTKCPDKSAVDMRTPPAASLSTPFGDAR